jgi:hypothetical protein
MIAFWRPLVTWYRSRVRFVEPAVVLDEDGFSLVRKGQECWHVRWSDIREVFAFKEDLLTVDRICLGFRITDDGTYYSVDEDMRGYPELLQEVERRFPDRDPHWWRKTAFPPFATCRTTIWGRPMPWE